LPLFQKRIFHQNFSYENEFDLHENERAGETFSHEWFRKKNRYETEAKVNSEMTWQSIIPYQLNLTWFG
jgi:hypothetical protein